MNTLNTTATAKLAKSQRAMSLARFQIGMKEKRRRWTLDARASFSPGDKRPCIVCGRYQSLAHAHHVFPLSIQFKTNLVISDRQFSELVDHGPEFVIVKEPDHEFVWMCPTHHEAAHEIIRALLANVQPDLDGMPAHERDAMQRISVRFVEKLVASGAIGAI